VSVRKKSGEIRICIDFRDLNRACLKDNYSLPSMEHILQAVTRSCMMCMLDGFFGYNRVLVNKQDRYKTAFITPWGTYSYIHMPFELMNVGATFQRAIDFDFSDYLFKFIVVYQNDLTVYSKNRNDHVNHLRKVFDRCRSLGISLNPKKPILGVFERKLPRHIVSKEGVRIDPERVKDIMEIPLPSSRKGIQSFFGRINFVRRFVPNIAEMAKPTSDMLKKDDDLKWSDEAKKAFNDIKQALCQSHVLISPGYAKDIQIFSFASDSTMVVVLLQKNEDGLEQPVDFMSKALPRAELDYKSMEKQAYALVKGLAHFRPYFQNSHIIAYVPHPMVKDILVRKD
jgi:hypothetical protein